jgi:hypothetical protein
MIRIVLASVLAFAAASGCKKKISAPAEPDSAPAAAPNPAPAAPASSAGGVVFNPSGALGGGGGGGAVQAVRKAARRTQALNELKNLGEFIELMRNDMGGRMPTKDQIITGIKKDAPGIAKAIEEGAYILTGTMDGGGLWAYEVDADKQPGVALIGGRAVRSTPEEIQQYLRRN